MVKVVLNHLRGVVFLCCHNTAALLDPLLQPPLLQLEGSCSVSVAFSVCCRVAALLLTHLFWQAVPQQLWWSCCTCELTVRQSGWVRYERTAKQMLCYPVHLEILKSVGCQPVVCTQAACCAPECLPCQVVLCAFYDQAGRPSHAVYTPCVSVSCIMP